MNLIGVIIIASLAVPAPKSSLITVPACRGQKVREYRPFELQINTRTIRTSAIGHLMYRDNHAGLKCDFYSSEAGKVFWQTQQNEDGSQTAWVVEPDGSYRKYDNARAVVYDFNISENEHGKDVLSVEVHVVDAKDAKIVKDVISLSLDLESQLRST